MKKRTRIFFLIVSVLSVSLFIIIRIQSLSPILFSTTFYWEEGLDIEFRSNGTYRAVNHDILASDVTCGRYKLQDSLIILLDKLKFSDSNMNDTLIATTKGVFFRMEEPGRVSEGIMGYVYRQTDKLLITNGTAHKIDSISIKMPYTKEANKYVSIEKNKSIEYNFNMNNPHVDGRYTLVFRVLDEPDKLKKIEDLTNGFPIETVKEILFHDNYITIETVFGNKITSKI